MAFEGKFKYLEDMPNYQMSPDEEYMNDKQLLHFKNKLIVLKTSILQEISESVESIKNSSEQLSDSLDRANHEESLTIELRTRGREAKLIEKINEALMRIMIGDYGYCSETGLPIGLARLDARPTSKLSVEVKNKLETEEKISKFPY